MSVTSAASLNEVGEVIGGCLNIDADKCGGVSAEMGVTGATGASGVVSPNWSSSLVVSLSSNLSAIL